MILIAGLDLETTGLDAEKHRIIEMALSIYDLETAKKLQTVEMRFNPRQPIDPKAQAVHGISASELVDCPLFADYASKIAAIIAKCDYLVAHNGIGFDFPFLAAELKRAGAAMPTDITFVDTMLDGRWSTEDGKQPRLSELAMSLGFVYDTTQAHSALYDTDLMMQCFFTARDKYGLFNIE